MTTATLTWLNKDSVSGNFAAVLAMSRRDWELAGATFTDVDDDGDVVPLAVGCVDIDGAPVEFGVTIEDDEVSRVIVGGAVESRPQLTAAIIRELVGLHVMTPEQVLHITGQAEPASTDDKVEYLAEAFRDFQAAVAATLLAPPAREQVQRMTTLALGNLRDLRTLPGVVVRRSEDRVEAREEVLIRITSPGLSEAARILEGSGTESPVAHMRSYDSVSGTATVMVADRIPLQLAGLTREPQTDDEFSILSPPVHEIAPSVGQLALRPTGERALDPDEIVAGFGILWSLSFRLA
jgi:hypothetical protein